jgi:hypothetical protein
MAYTPQSASYPWATWDMEETDRLGKPVHVCPTCQERIIEPNIKGRNYMKHYDTMHANNA